MVDTTIFEKQLELDIPSDLGIYYSGKRIHKKSCVWAGNQKSLSVCACQQRKRMPIWRKKYFFEASRPFSYVPGTADSL